MAFVGMPDYRSQSQRTECPHTADSEQDLLAEAEFLVSAVQPCGEGAVARCIVWHVGVEQVQRDPSHTDLPDQGRYGSAPHFNLDLAGSARWRQGLLDWRIQAVERLVDRFLPALGCNPLAEVPLRVHEADTHQRNPEVARFLAMIASQDAQTAAINRNRNMESELGRKIRDAGRRNGGVLVREPGILWHNVVVR